MVPNPADQSETIWMTWMDKGLVDRAVESARSAFESYTTPFHNDLTPFYGKLKAQLLNRRRELARTIALATGRPTWETELEVKASITMARRAEGVPPPRGMTRHGDFVRIPVGVIAFRCASDLPLLNTIEILVEAIAAGDSVVLLPPPEAGPVGLILAEMLHECDLDQGSFNLVQGDDSILDYLRGHPGVDRFITPPDQGPPKGGGSENDGLILREDDLDHAANAAAVGCFLSAGQRRDSLKRIFVEKDVAEEFAQALGRAASSLVPGDPVGQGRNRFFGPLATKENLQAFLEFEENGPGIPMGNGNVDEENGKKLPENGLWAKPSVRLLQLNEARPARVPIGPTVLVMAVNGLDEVLPQARLEPSQRTFTFLGRGTAKLSMVRALRSRFVGVGITSPGEWLRMSGEDVVTLPWERQWRSNLARSVILAEELRDDPFAGLPGLGTVSRS
ncbi:MAG: aldehyde dehydrogenase [Deltaproteobacteria bacterium]|nr:aldehyde dehydrogenase [Deltaproteobacteria bacterium]